MKKLLLITFTIFLCILLESCKATYRSYDEIPEPYAFKIIKDTEVMIVKSDSTYILDCIRQNPVILEQILSNDGKRDSLSTLKVKKRGSSLGKNLFKYSNYTDGYANYLLCIKPDGSIALNKLLSSSFKEKEIGLKRIQHMAFEYEFEARVDAKCLDCGALRINMSGCRLHNQNQY